MYIPRCSLYMLVYNTLVICRTQPWKWIHYIHRNYSNRYVSYHVRMALEFFVNTKRNTATNFGGKLEEQ